MVKKILTITVTTSGIMAFLGAFGASMRFYGSVEPTLIDIRYAATECRTKQNLQGKKIEDLLARDELNTKRIEWLLRKSCMSDQNCAESE